ncbi:MAG: MFS transporter [Planctomycetes bacterium]|nr:MFS transporter [Planctomycetota bacterium]
MRFEQLDPPEPATKVRYVVLIALCLAATIAYIQRNTLGVVEKEMRHELHLTTSDSALVMTTGFFITYALFQVPSGWLGHVWGSRRTLALFTAVCAAMHALCFGLVSVPLFAGARGVMGLTQAPLFPCATGTIKSWFPNTRWGTANGLLTAFMQIGGAGGTIAVAYLAAQGSWRTPFLVFAIPGLLWSAWFWFWFRDLPQQHAGVNRQERLLIAGTESTVEDFSPAGTDEIRECRADSDQIIEHVPWGTLLLSPAMFWICMQQFFRGAGYMFYGSWFTTYLRESRAVEIKAAGWLTSVPLWAYAVGSLLGGGLSDWLLARTGSRRFSRQGLAVISQWVCAGFVLIAYTVDDAVGAVLIISVGSFCAAVGGPIAYAITIDMGGRHVRSVFSLMNMFGNIGALVFPLIVPVLVGQDPRPEDWDLVLPVFAALFGLAGLAWLGFNPDRSIFPEDNSGVCSHAGDR